MKLILCFVLLWYFHSTHNQLNALTGSGRDPMQSYFSVIQGDPDGPFFAGRGRRGGVNVLDLQSQNNGDPGDNSDVRGRYIGSDSESKLRLEWLPAWDARPLIKVAGLSPSSSLGRHMSIANPNPYYMWYNIRKKQGSLKPDPDESPFMAVRG